MKGILNPQSVADMSTVASWLRHGDTARHMVRDNYPDLSDAEAIAALTAENIVAQLDNLKTHPCVATRTARGELAIHGWLYHIKSGRVDSYNEALGKFVPLDGTYVPSTNRRPQMVPIVA
jgi:carbonic anhydrase